VLDFTYKDERYRTIILGLSGIKNFWHNILQNGSAAPALSTLKLLIFFAGLYFPGYFVLAFPPFRNLKAGKAH
jgi:hypothetical protein